MPSASTSADAASSTKVPAAAAQRPLAPVLDPRFHTGQAESHGHLPQKILKFVGRGTGDTAATAQRQRPSGGRRPAAAAQRRQPSGGDPAAAAQFQSMHARTRQVGYQLVSLVEPSCSDQASPIFKVSHGVRVPVAPWSREWGRGVRG